MERKLRIPCENYVRRSLNITNDDILHILETMQTSELKIVDLSRIQADNCKEYHPRTLSNLLLGYLKLAQISPLIKEKLELISQELPVVVESWIKEDSAFHEDNTRLLVNFMSQLHIPNATLSEWLTNKSEIFHKSSDLLLKYIADNWKREDFQVGNYLVEKTNENIDLLSVFIPILNYICDRVPGYQTVFIEKIPLYWNNAS